MISTADRLHAIGEIAVSHYRTAGFAWPWRSDADDLARTVLAGILLQRTRREHAAHAYRRIVNRWPTAYQLVMAGPALEAIVADIGLPHRARIIREVMRRIARGKGRWATVPGVGPYVRAMVAAIHFRAPVVVLDDTTTRVYRRVLGVALARDRRTLLRAARATIPVGASREHLWGVLDIADRFCHPKIPHCDDCPLRSVCAVGSRQVTNEPPNTSAAPSG